MKTIMMLLLCTLLISCVPNEPMVLKSPDKSLQVFLQIDHNNSLVFFASKSGKQLVSESHLGVEFSQGSFTSGVTLGEISRVNKLTSAKASLTDAAITGKANERTIELINRNNERLLVRLRVWDDAIAIQYESELKGYIAERTSFNFAPDASMWVNVNKQGEQSNTQVVGVASEASDNWLLPVTIKSGEFRIKLVEVNSNNVSSCVLTDGLATEIGFMWGCGEPVSATAVPWRVLRVDTGTESR